jgi:hypothetical protein
MRILAPSFVRRQKGLSGWAMYKREENVNFGVTMDTQ